MCKPRPWLSGIQRPCPHSIMRSFSGCQDRAIVWALPAGNDSARAETSSGGGRGPPSLTGHRSLQGPAPAPAPLPQQGPPRGGPDWEVPRQTGDSTGNGSGGFRRPRGQCPPPRPPLPLKPKTTVQSGGRWTHRGLLEPHRLAEEGQESRPRFKKALSPGLHVALRAAGNPTRGGEAAWQGAVWRRQMKFRQTPRLSTSGKGWL